MKYRLQFNPGEYSYKPRLFTDAIKIIVSVNFAIYILQSFSGKEDVFFRLFGLVPSSFISSLMLWQPFTYMFFHAPFYTSVGISHILLNESDGSYNIHIKKNNEVMPWKKFNSNMAISVEYDLEY